MFLVPLAFIRYIVQIYDSEQTYSMTHTIKYCHHLSVAIYLDSTCSSQMGLIISVYLSVYRYTGILIVRFDAEQSTGVANVSSFAGIIYCVYRQRVIGIPSTSPYVFRCDYGEVGRVFHNRVMSTIFASSPRRSWDIYLRRSIFNDSSSQTVALSLPARLPAHSNWPWFWTGRNFKVSTMRLMLQRYGGM